jgi:hypothetical protein
VPATANTKRKKGINESMERRVGLDRWAKFHQVPFRFTRGEEEERRRTV